MSIKKKIFPFYQVREGENLKTIAEKFDINPTKILIDNNITPKQIKNGIFIKIEK
jgi:hypothetical protein